MVFLLGFLWRGAGNPCGPPWMSLRSLICKVPFLLHATLLLLLLMVSTFLVSRLVIDFGFTFSVLLLLHESLEFSSGLSRKYSIMSAWEIRSVLTGGFLTLIRRVVGWISGVVWIFSRPLDFVWGGCLLENCFLLVRYCSMWWQPFILRPSLWNVSKLANKCQSSRSVPTYGTRWWVLLARPTTERGRNEKLWNHHLTFVLIAF